MALAGAAATIVAAALGIAPSLLKHDDGSAEPPSQHTDKRPLTPVVVPELAGAGSAHEAQQKLQRAGLVLKRPIETTNRPDVAIGTVLRQDPPAGTNVRSHAAVGVVVAVGGRRTGVMPDITGLDVAAAMKLLRLTRAEPRVVGKRVSGVRPGTIIAETPAAGDRLGIGGEVAVMVALGPSDVPVPNLERLTVRQAQAALTKGQLTLGAVDPLTSSKKRRVAGQEPSPGEPVKTGTPVSVTLAP